MLNRYMAPADASLSGLGRLFKMISTLLFLAFPVSVSFSVKGRYSPNPIVETRCGLMLEFESMYSATAAALAMESRKLLLKGPTSNRNIVGVTGNDDIPLGFFQDFGNSL